MKDKKYVLRLHEGSNNIEHWQKSSAINHKIADTIKDPEEAKLKDKKGEYNEVTSIPSPFARLELIKIAFKFVADGQLDGNTFYHKIVSDTLDIAQVFFNFLALQNQFEIIRWQSGLQKSGNDFIIKPESDLGKLLNSNENNQKLYGETLRLFILNDAKSPEPNFNFDLLEDIYLLHYKKGPDRLNIIGGTNPATLFWATPNPIPVNNIQFGNDKLFDDVFCPLHKREKDFVIFMYLLREQIQNFPKRFPTLQQYMEACFKLLDDEVKQEIDNRKWENYPDLKTTEGYTVKPTKDFYLKCKSNDIDEAQLKDCDFYIQSQRFKKLYPSKKTPVVLPVENLNKNYKLFGTTWDANWKPVFYDEKPIEERSIPYLTGKQYPYLCISDFFHDYILKLPYKLHAEHFFTFTKEDSEYLIPLKPAIFDYFTLEELQERITFDPKDKKLSIEIPLNNQSLKWSRTYKRLNNVNAKNDNCGGIEDLNVSFVCYPHFKFPENITPHKVVGLYCTEPKQKVSFNFYHVPDDGMIENLEKTEFVKSKIQTNDLYTSIYYNLEKDFEVIELVTEQNQALIFPKFKKPVLKESKQAIYALDFGTTNTYIEWKLSDDDNQKFSWENLPWLHSLQYSDKEKLDGELLNLWRAIVYEFLPLFDKINERYQFPIQSLIAYDAHFNEENKKLHPIIEMNIPYWYPYLEANDLKIESNIKWSEKNSNDLSKLIEGFLIQLLFMIRNHAIQNGVKPENLKLVSFYPHSMRYEQRNRIKSFIKELYKRYFSQNEDNIIFYPESITPYKYFTEKEGAFVVDGFGIHLDIGGGTTDIVFYFKSDYHRLSSIKFAGQDIFGDRYSEAKQQNGWVNYFSEKIQPVLEEKNINFPKAGSIPSTSYMNLLLNIHEAFEVKEKKLDISLAKEIDKTIAFKIIIFYHFASIVYYLAKLQQQIYKQNPEANQRYNTIPRYFTFSGRASQLLKIADNESKFTKKLIREIYQDTLGISDENAKIELKFTENPKEITCKGGIEMVRKDNKWDEDDAENITTYWYGATRDIQNKIFSEIENNYTLMDEIAQTAYQFHEKFFEYMEKIKFFKEFDVEKSLRESFQNIADKQYMKDNLGRALDKVSNKNNEIEGESLFFYPLKQVLFDMGKLAWQESKKQKT